MTLTKTLTHPFSTPTFPAPLTHSHASAVTAEQGLTKTLTHPHADPHANPLTIPPLSINRGKREGRSETINASPTEALS